MNYAKPGHAGCAGDSVLLDLMTCADLPSPPLTPTLSSPSPLLLTYDRFKTFAGNEAQMYEADFGPDEGPQLHVLVKTYHDKNMHLLRHEFNVYTAVAHLSIVPKLHAVIKSRSRPHWGGLIMEHAGTSLAAVYEEGDFECIELTPQERLEIYDAFRQLHVAGVVHGDVAPRNILRRPNGAFCLVDFDKSSLNHPCEGLTCPELAQLQRDLKLETV
ncbi:hypothetical protein DFH07DRAFT_86406 [Mycena maculata]|uniref:Protein kinase domain-containing protein n=1 Tax=Mycena maculata TaxID=230809 RepID=A0AAD7MYH9_9AGAR|nr:hypothetical protein DFH07DRAFT_86406 [Mycena maculata]